jgi:glutamate synthase (NADPH/NADH) small chain
VGKPTGFLDHSRRDPLHRPAEERVRDAREIDVPLTHEEIRNQAARCMDCGVPFCHGVGCPLESRIPEFNDLLYRGRWREASDLLHSTNNFPEFTGRLCPALCESACSLSINDQPVLIRHIDWQIVERAWQEGWIVPLPPARRTGRKVAIVGSGPAGLTAAQQLARSGHDVTVFEKDHGIGGLLRYGIPDFKLDKGVLDRRLAQLAAEGVHFQTDADVGEDISAKYLRKTHDAILLAMGAGQPRELNVPGRELAGVVLALDYLSAQNRLVARGAGIPPLRDAGIPSRGPKGLPARIAGVSPAAASSVASSSDELNARDKVVAVIGGGDTGSDCVGTARRQGAREIHQLEILPEPPIGGNPETPWPQWPRILRTSSSHEEGCIRHWSVLTTRLEGAGSDVQRVRKNASGEAETDKRKAVTALHGVNVEWRRGPRGMEMKPIPGTEFVIPVDLVIVAMGFLHVPHSGLVDGLGLKLDDRGNIALDATGMTSTEGVFAAGDAHRGASLVVHAIASGRASAAAIDRWLAKK